MHPMFLRTQNKNATEVHVIVTREMVRSYSRYRKPNPS